MDVERHLSDLMTEFKTGTLVTRTPDGQTHARPMTVAGLSTAPFIYLATRLSPHRVAAVEARPDVVLVFQTNLQFLNLDGTARVSRDPALIEKLWSESWAAWFPSGKRDPDLCLLEIDPRGGTYWEYGAAAAERYVIDGMKVVFERRSAQPDVDKPPAPRA